MAMALHMLGMDLWTEQLIFHEMEGKNLYVDSLIGDCDISSVSPIQIPQCSTESSL